MKWQSKSGKNPLLLMVKMKIDWNFGWQGFGRGLQVISIRSGQRVNNLDKQALTTFGQQGVGKGIGCA